MVIVSNPYRFWMASRSITRPGRIRSAYRRSSPRSGSSALAHHPAAVKRFGRRNRDLQQVPRRLRTGERAIVAIVFSIDGAITSRIDHREVIWLEALSESAQSASSRCSESVRLCAAFVSTRNCAIELQRARQSPTIASNSSRSRVGGAAWNIVPSGNKYEAPNFGEAGLPHHETRYAVRKNSWKLSRGVGILGKTTLSFEKADVFADTTKLHLLNHRRDYLSVRGHLNIARPPQGYPVLVQAGASESGIRFAAGRPRSYLPLNPRTAGTIS